MEKEKQRCYPNLGSVTTSSIFFKITFLMCCTTEEKTEEQKL